MVTSRSYWMLYSYQVLKKISALPLIVLLLNSCATGYHAEGFSGGYNQLRLSEDEYLVGFSGNAYTGMGKVHTFVMRRAAELTKEKGYKYFVVLNRSDQVDQSSYRTPITSSSTSNYNLSAHGYGYGSNSNLYGNTNTTISGGDVIVYNRPSARVKIRMYKNQVAKSINADIFLSNFTE